MLDERRLRVITLQNVLGSEATRCKVWDSGTGDLLRVLSHVSSQVCKLVVPHPLNPAFALTGGDDGVLRVGDLDREELIFQHAVKAPASNTHETPGQGYPHRHQLLPRRPPRVGL